VLAFVLMRKLWHWPLWIALPLLLIFLTIDLSFFSANAIKLFHGGWFPIVVAIALFVLLVTWKRGRKLLLERLSPGAIPIEPFIQSVTATYNGKTVLSAQWGPAVSKNPFLSFKFKGGAKGDKVQVTWTDNRGEKRTDEATIG